jgi:hypothetical protein
MKKMVTRAGPWRVRFAEFKVLQAQRTSGAEKLTTLHRLMLLKAKSSNETGRSRNHLFQHTVEIVPVAHSLQFSFFILECAEATLIGFSLSALDFFLSSQTSLFLLPATKK